MTSTVSGTSVAFSLPSVGGIWTWKVQANNLSAAGQLYEVIDIITPYGPFTSTMIPIPGEVITEMANSIVSIQQQFAPFMILDPLSHTTFSLVITEGDPNSDIGTITVLNAGAFGSFMTVIATPGAPWLSVSPSSVQDIGKNGYAVFDCVLITTPLLASVSPYSGTIILQDNRTPSTFIPIIVNVTVLPRPVITSLPTTVSLVFISSTGTPGGSQSVVISNSGPADSSLSFTLAKLGSSNWLNFTPTSGGPLVSGGSVTSVFSIVAAAAAGLVPGTYIERVRVSSPNASNSPIDIVVNLTVMP